MNDWLGASNDELIHFITDETHLKEMEAVTKWAIGADAILKTTVLPSHLIQKGDVIQKMKNILSNEDVIIGATDHSFITSGAIKYAVANGARFLSLPLSCSDGTSLLENDFITMDTKTAAKDARKLIKELDGAKSVHITTAKGTDIYFDIEGRVPGSYTGTARKKREITSSSFETYIAPVEDKTHGTLILDASFGYIGLVNNPVKIVFENGKIISCESEGNDAQKLLDYIESFNDPKMLYPGELGIGLNRISKVRGVSYIEDESAYHTFHIGMGRNISLGGKQDAGGHFDLVTNNPDIEVDGKLIMKQGDLL